MDERFVDWVKRPLPKAKQYSLYSEDRGYDPEFYYWMENLTGEYEYTSRQQILKNLNDPLSEPPMEEVLERIQRENLEKQQWLDRRIRAQETKRKYNQMYYKMYNRYR